MEIQQPRSKSMICRPEINNPWHKTSPGPYNSPFRCWWCSYYPKIHIWLWLSLDPQSSRAPYCSTWYSNPSAQRSKFLRPSFLHITSHFISPQFFTPVVRMMTKHTFWTQTSWVTVTSCVMVMNYLPKSSDFFFFNLWNGHHNAKVPGDRVREHIRIHVRHFKNARHIVGSQCLLGFILLF